MKIVQFNENKLAECAEFWWSIYKDMIYVHRPDGYQTVNTPPIGPQYFIKHLNAGLSGSHTRHWCGEVTDDTIFLVVEGRKVEGILVSSIDTEHLTANILSAYMHRTHRGREIATKILSFALDRFRQMGLREAMAAPGVSKSLEVECPIHLAMLDEGFAWQNSWLEPEPPGSRQMRLKWGEEYGIFLGGSLFGFQLHPTLEAKIDQLRDEDIVIERCELSRFHDLRQARSPENLGGLGNLTFGETFVGLADGVLVGWLGEMQTFEDEGRIMGGVVPRVMPEYRRKGIGKVLYHLGIQEVVRRGAQYGWTATEIHNTARLIYHSIGYQHWYLCYSRLSRRLK